MTELRTRPLVSVCVANYNGETLLTDCIGSILRQKNAPEFEILVHDDASTDESLRVLEAFASVRVIKSSENVGFCISNNRMAAVARGEFILLLNNDAQLFDDALATLFDESHRHDETVVLGLPQYETTTGKLVDFGLQLDWFCSPVQLKQPSRTDVAMVIGACVWMPTKMWQAIGGFPEWFETNAEDVYLCCYARFLGCRIHVPARSGFLHLIGHSLGGGKATNDTLRISTRRRYFSERNRLFVQWIFYPAWLIPFTTIANVATLAVEALVLSIASRKPSLIYEIYIKSQLDALAGIGTVRSTRARAWHARKISSSAFFSRFTFIPQKLRLLMSAGLPKPQASTPE